MDKIKITNDFYEVEHIIKDMFGDSLIAFILLSDWKPQKQSGGITSRFRKNPFWGIKAGDSVDKIYFSYEVPFGINIKGEYLYRVNRHGIKILSGTTIFIEYDE
jgi:hypothetical protein